VGEALGREANDAAPYRHLYVHVPFCARRCTYCDFSIAVRRNVPVQEFVSAVRAELALRRVAEQRPSLGTLYLGGGTPSRLGGDGVGALLDTIRDVADIEPDAEVTLEANPEDISVDAVREWRRAGVNRLSVGIQSFDDRVLRWMHRVHDAESAMRAVQAARDGGIEAFSLDLIFALPEGIERDWNRDLDEVMALGPQHVSIYGLTVESGTPLGRWRARGEVVEAPEERYESEFLAAHDALESAGFAHYEVSNFALPGHTARHNSAYWQAVPYLGIGPSAHGFDGAERSWNVAAYAAWLRALEGGEPPVAGSEVLSPENRVAETVYLGLRTSLGLDISEHEWESMSPWVAAGWVERVHQPAGFRIRCTPQGWLRLDALAADLTSRRSHS
jgi:oxygen-independent coproporphyrinogen-3 oxidase